MGFPMLDNAIASIEKKFDAKFEELVTQLDRIEKKVDDLLRKE